MSYKECGWSPGPERADANFRLKVETIDKLREVADQYRTIPAYIVEDALATFWPTLRLASDRQNPLPEAPRAGGGGRILQQGKTWETWGGSLGEGGFPTKWVDCQGCIDCKPEPESVDGEESLAGKLLSDEAAEKVAKRLWACRIAEGEGLPPWVEMTDAERALKIDNGRNLILSLIEDPATPEQSHTEEGPR